MKYLSVCSGIEAATVAWNSVGFSPVGFSEIEKFPSAVLEHHYPHVENFGDMTKFKEWNHAAFDILVGGTPCQSFSVAGLRKGLDDPRGNLMLTYLAIAAKHRPKWLVWENVPGVLSSNGGRDFAALLRGLDELGYGWAYRVLDAQYFGVAQRRRRVFVVGYLGNCRSSAAVLFERESLRRNTAPSRKAEEKAAPTVGTGAPFSRTGNERVEIDAYVTSSVAARMVAFGEYIADETASTLKQRDYKDVTDIICFHPTQDPISNTNDVTHTIGCGSSSGCSTSAIAVRTANTNANGHGVSEELTHTLDRANGQAVICTAPIGLDQEHNAMVNAYGTLLNKQHSGGFQGSVMQPDMQVRRLTPIECERLQGFPDNYTDIKPNGKPTPDSPRYKALGNSMAVPCMNWIGKRIAVVDAIKNQKIKDAA